MYFHSNGRKKKKIRNNILSGVLLILLFGCAPTQKIVYKVDDINHYSNSHLNDLTISINEFQDVRKKPKGLTLRKTSPGYIKTDTAS